MSDRRRKRIPRFTSHLLWRQQLLLWARIAHPAPPLCCACGVDNIAADEKMRRSWAVSMRLDYTR